MIPPPYAHAHALIERVAFVGYYIGLLAALALGLVGHLVPQPPWPTRAWKQAQLLSWWLAGRVEIHGHKLPMLDDPRWERCGSDSAILFDREMPSWDHVFVGRHAGIFLDGDRPIACDQRVSRLYLEQILHHIRQRKETAK